MASLTRSVGRWVGQNLPATTKSHKISPKRVPSSSAALVYQNNGKVGKANVSLFRNWAEHSEWVRAAINVRKSQVSSAEWAIEPYDFNRPVSIRAKRALQEFFDRPNPMLTSFRSFIEPIVEDMMVLDAGVIEVERNLFNRPMHLWAVDGGQIKVNALWDGDEEEARYFWYPDGFERARLLNRDLVYLMANPRTYSPVGLAPLETLKWTIDAELAGHAYNHRQVTNAAPDGMLDLGEGARPEQVERFESYWRAEVAGQGAMAFIGGTKNAKFIPFRASNRDMQFLEWQIYLVRKIAAVFGLTPQDLGITFDVNRSTSEVQQEQTEDRGLRPLLALIQDYLTREICWDEGFGGPDNNLAFRFTGLNLRETLNKAQINKLALSGSPYKTINEARLEEGREPLGPEYDKLIMVTPTGAVTLEDVPTAREVIESKNTPKPGSAPGKASGQLLLEGTSEEN
jgi:hypothetical protein